ncbi:MAG: hypothetical protein U1F20_05035 [Lysobacterales bacterium]
MPERSGTLRAFALGAGALLAIGASAAGGIVAAVGGWLAQPLLALLVRDPRGERPFAWADAFALAQRWAVALLLAGLLLAWPLASLLFMPGLAGVRGLSAVVGLGLVALWYGWTAWHRVETGHAARRARRRPRRRPRGRDWAWPRRWRWCWPRWWCWRGPGRCRPTRGAGSRWPALLWPALHGWMQREVVETRLDAREPDVDDVDDSDADAEIVVEAPSAPVAAVPAPDLAPGCTRRRAATRSNARAGTARRRRRCARDAAGG